MQKLLNLVLIITFFVSISAMAQPTELVEIKRVMIPEELFLGGFFEIDIQDERILISDNSLIQVVLFTGKEWKILDPEECHPGFKFYPWKAEFGDHDEIFITNSGIWGFRFKKNGDCVGAVQEKSIMPEQFDYGKDIVGFSKDFIKYDIRTWDKKGEEKGVAFSVENEFPNAEYRFKGGGIFEADNIIYFTKAFEPVIYSFNRKTKKLVSKGFNSDIFNPISADISKDFDASKLPKEIGKIIKNNSVIYNAYQLNKNSGVVLFNQHVDKKSVTFGLIFNLSDLSVKKTLVFETLPDFISNDEFVFIERENDGYEDEVIELVFRRVKEN
tara:strand:- start:286678 stop:287661 length:984 start_codon:yes stop_codon:yes gene_type:complete